MMNGANAGSAGLGRPLIARLDAAVDEGPCEQVCSSIKTALVDLLAAGTRFLPEAFLAPGEECYSRRLLHLDPAGRYSVVVMVWAPGQGTPIHDHDGKWCVEGVYCGRIRVTSYTLDGTVSSEHYRFRKDPPIEAGPGEAGALIPPFEYHTIDNPHDDIATSIHVYCGEMTRCHVFFPERDGLYRREARDLSYTP